MRARDQRKDQSYFLYGIPRHRLEHLVLPLGEMHKEEVRALAREAGLPVARRPESMELCFVGAGDYRNALTEAPSADGPILDSQGTALGQHKGIANYTVGQRKGLGIASDKPLYVTGILPERNAVQVGSWDEALHRAVTASDVNLLIPELVHPGSRLYGKIRSQGSAAACEVADVQGQAISVVFDQPQFAPAPGQRLVLYNADEHVVAGGKIQ